jgi:hypothetical protein
MQLEAYFQKGEKEMIWISETLNPKGTDFQQKEVESVIRIPYGKPERYLEQSKYWEMSKQLGPWLPPMEKSLWIIALSSCHVVRTVPSPVMQEVYGVKNGFGT